MAETVKVQPNSGDQKAFVPTISSYPATGCPYTTWWA
ncbi:hypothetical protein PF010_g21439 [Phytophthora fragariae]|uniref:Uncharacterized protein n=1 Tax=Phytophthora fragariae TaxID=53985 RepID=A0A6G0QUF0_9STRA|nr:hypothetical protein PF010_g21439 [Phytophthora fragariae]KAE9303581.1 hypothetical protein PF008_g22193 [Phytophthora fragariae]